MPIYLRRILVALLLGGLAYLLLVGLPDHAPPSLVPWQFDLQTAQAEGAKSHKPLLVYFTASWCPPCQQLKHTLWPDKDVASALSSVIPVELDVDNPANQQPYLQWIGGPNINIPAFVIINQSQRRGTAAVGGMDKESFLQWLNEQNK